MDIEEVDRNSWPVPFDPLTGLKAFVVANALTEIEEREGNHFSPLAAVA